MQGVAGGAAWPVIAGKAFVAGAQVSQWALPCFPSAVVCLRRRPPQAADYPAEWRGLTVWHLPLTYWQDGPVADPVARLRTVVEAVCRSGKPVVVHCALGLDRAGIVALALLLSSGLPLPQALQRYRMRGVRLPDNEAMCVLRQFAAEQERGRDCR
ncbi:tyrosine-protein phosphatase [Streptomyces roseifaciens]